MARTNDSVARGEVLSAGGKVTLSPLPRAHANLLREVLRAGREGIEGDLATDRLEPARRAHLERELDSYRRLLAGLDGEAIEIDPRLIEVVGHLAESIDQQNDYEQAALEHRAFCGLLGQLEGALGEGQAGAEGPDWLLAAIGQAAAEPRRWYAERFGGEMVRIPVPEAQRSYVRDQLAWAALDLGGELMAAGDAEERERGVRFAICAALASYQLRGLPDLEIALDAELVPRILGSTAWGLCGEDAGSASTAQDAKAAIGRLRWLADLADAGLIAWGGEGGDAG